jgi:predicted NBD/HSP70 family sugar kinase
VTARPRSREASSIPADGSGRRFGVDVGGTKIRAALAAADGTVLAECVVPTGSDSAADLVARIAAILDRLRAEAGGGPDDGPVAAAGIAIPGAVDPRTGRLDSVHNLPGLATTDDLRSDLVAALGMPVAIDNDANAAALAEHARGVAKGVDDVAVLALGTGIGLGLIAGGRLIRGWRGMAGEIAFLPIGPPIPSGPAEAWVDERSPGYEALVAGPGVRRRIDAIVASGAPTRLEPGATLGDAVEAAAAGDGPAIRLVREEARLIAVGIAAVAALLDPSLVVLSGGVGALPGLLEPVRAEVARLVLVPPRIETGALGERGPLVGALELAAAIAPHD